MSKMIQIIGGVAVAGVVAAGSTAFTAAGFTLGTGFTAPIVIGGSLSPTIVGATLEGLTFTYNAGNSEVTDMTVRMKGDGGVLPLGSRVTVVTVGTRSVVSTEFYCAPSVTDGGVYQKAVCTVGTSLVAPTGNITAISALTITVQGPVT